MCRWGSRTAYDQADDPGKNVVHQAHPAAHPAHRAGKLDGAIVLGAAHLVRRLLQALRLLGRNDNRFQIVERARQMRRQTVGQKADRRMALSAVPAGNLCAGRGLALVGAVACHGTAAVRVIGAALKPCIAPRFGPNVFLAGKPRLVTKLHTGHGPAGFGPRGPLPLCPWSVRDYGTATRGAKPPHRRPRPRAASRIRPSAPGITKPVNVRKIADLLSR